MKTNPCALPDSSNASGADRLAVAFESLQTTLERMVSAGLSIQASFVWAKIITDADSCCDIKSRLRNL
jgi:hypothetical protein